ncbi:MAG: Asp-tRNA(Asn)/Glu-tRNA(Gln) amidotransferase subunit GatA [Bacteroidetes bacterium]|nr:Asp-tRNA(Asn)/Glu-tRNA(Gln) amidotransferase subunit GatA [Bacteroidota bacterium]
MSESNSLTEIRTKIFSGQTSCETLAREYLQKIKDHQDLNAFLEVFEEETLLRAKEIDSKIQSGKAGKLAGLFIGIKDNICYKGHKVTAASKILQNFESVYHSTVVDKLLAEDAIIIGRLNCDEFAMGASNENSAFGAVKNFADTSRVSGGSSGGPAVAVQAGMCHASLGSDTGGSIRQPASFCGLWGFKPSYGVVSRYGLIAYASSFDQIGPLTKSADDMALLMEIISGKDDYDATMLEECPDCFLEQGESGKKLSFAVFNECIQSEGIAPEVKECTLAVIETLKKQGHTVNYIDFPLINYLVPTYYALSTAEASSNLSRFNGLLYGYRSPNSNDLDSMFKKTRSEGFGKEVKRRIMLGTYMLTSEKVDAFYTKALKVRRLIKEFTDNVFEQNNFILTPTTSTPAFKIGEKSKDPLSMYLADIFTVHANLAGIPAISIPISKTKEGLPFGMQLMAAQGQDPELIKTAASFFQSCKQN